MDYWVERNRKAQQALTDKSIKEVNKQLVKYYGASMEKILGQFEKTYNKVLLNIEEGRQPTPADLYKLDTYWQQQAQLRIELEKLGAKQAAALSKQFEILFFDVYYSIAIPGTEAFTTIDAATAQEMINAVWLADKKSWSERVWENLNLLQETLNEEMIACVVAGKKTSELLKTLQERFDVSYSRADALVRTEMAHIETQAARQRYKDYGIKEMEVWVDEDERTCPICAKMEGKRVSVNGKMPVPAHPRCRCCMIPVVEF